MVLPPQPRREPLSATAIQEREHEYMAWLIELPDPARDDEARDESWERFLRERRAAREKARLQRREAQRVKKRRAERAHLAQQYELALQAGVPWAINEQIRRTEQEQRRAGSHAWQAAAAERQRQYMDWLHTLPKPEGDVQQPDNSWQTFMADHRRKQERARLAQRIDPRKVERHARGLKIRPAGQGLRYGGLTDPAVRVVGRPVNPESKRQKRLAARRVTGHED